MMALCSGLSVLKRLRAIVAWRIPGVFIYDRVMFLDDLHF